MSGMRGDRYRTNGRNCLCCSGYLPVTRADEKRLTAKAIQDEMEMRRAEAAAADELSRMAQEDGLI